MRRSSTIALVAGLAAAGTLTAVASLPNVRNSRMLHPFSKKPIVVPGEDGAGRLLFSGWRVQPAGRPLSVGDMPYAGAFSPDGKLFAVANSGYTRHELHLIDVASEKEVAALPMNTSWNGICWSPDGSRLFVSGGAQNRTADIHVFVRGGDGAWQAGTGLKLTGNTPERSCIGGLAISADGKTLFAANISDDHLYVLTGDGTPLARVPVGDHPGACQLSADGKTLYVANWGGSEAVAVDVSSPEQPKLTRRFTVGKHPADLTLSKDDRLFVACSSADQVSVVDLKTGQTTETIRTTLTPNAPGGTTPDAVTLSPDGKTLYVANADNNNVCVADVSQRGRSRVRGFIPTGWYPTTVRVTPDGKKVIIGTGKGQGTGTNVTRVEPNGPPRRVHHGNLLRGILSFVDTPDDRALADYTRIVRANTPYNNDKLRQQADSRVKTAIPNRVGDSSPIKYVLYIIKENRTYDQVFGDLPQGNADPSLVMFGRDVTPNHHALAEEFVLLDNLYCSGEVSQDGHPWSTSAYATAFTQRSWVLGYSGKGKPADEPSVNDPVTGYFWEACKAKGLTFRSYGEYRNHPTLAGNVSEPYSGKVQPGENPPGRDFEKADVFIREFKEMERENRIPRFTVMSLGEDHTSGTRPGTFTPQACVASNDVALGKIVETISKSSVWKEFAIFVIEDDAQNGPDHIDSHRTIGLVISPYTRRKTIDSTLYTTCSMLRTMELILGLPPMTQYDAAATPMFASFTDKADLTPYTGLPARIDLMAKNPGTAVGARESMKLDFTEYDRLTVAEEDTLNRVLWHSIKGKDVPYPGATRSAIAP
ncbi:MAG: selenium-binding protein SBP56-related protein [Capsulimonadales bacterium]|nr:selenium-binding protein SBP56-related protein [Capsulimonadales bacterium]